MVKEVEAEKARQGEIRKESRYILLASAVIVVLLMGGAYIFSV